MKTFDLMLVQHDLQRQLKSSEELFDVADALRALAARLEDKVAKEQLEEAATNLAGIGNRLVNNAGRTSQELVEFLSS